ncbi:MAG: FAD binding domain-containing protein [Spirochaetaceae bacterium]|jgi:CO/xanthine dehydrogenase FAD-binding subunit|nr:FAD binding domain-containing protein [Spirochaetaceae bacterium]
MGKINRPPVIYSPSSLQDLLRIYNLNKDAVIYAGGTWSLLNQEKEHFNMKGSVINIMAIEELKKINRTDRYLELGAAVTVSRTLDLGKSIVPEALYQALKQLGPPQIRNMATIGGNLCVSNSKMDLFPMLHLHDAQIELKKQKDLRSPRRLLKGDSRWIPASRFITSEGKTCLSPGEILTRIRIPNDSWEYQSYTKTGGISSPLVFSGLAGTDKHILTDFRICFSTAKEKIIRNRDMEADLIGRRLPFTRKEISHLNSKITKIFQSVNETDFTTARAIALTNQFIEKISLPIVDQVIF